MAITLHLAYTEGVAGIHASFNVPALRQLLALGAAVNLVDDHGRTALHWANDITAMRILLDAGANPSIRDHDGNNPHAYFAKHIGSDPELCALLRNWHAQIKLEFYVTNVSTKHATREFSQASFGYSQP